MNPPLTGVPDMDFMMDFIHKLNRFIVELYVLDDVVVGRVPRWATNDFVVLVHPGGVLFQLAPSNTT